MLPTKVIDNKECSRDLIVDVVNNNSLSIDSFYGEFLALNQEISNLKVENERLKGHIDYLEYEVKELINQLKNERVE